MTARTLSLGELQDQQIFGIPVLDYCRLTARSGLLDDSAVLFKRLGLHPRVGFRSLYLKDDGFWSFIWGISFPKADIRSIVEEGLVLQDLKRYGLTLFTY